MRVIFMGTPDFAVPVLKALKEAGHDVVLVVSQPDRQKGRGKKVLYTPVKECALEYDLPVYQPEKIKAEGVYEELASYQPDVMVVAAFGQILPKKVLELPKYGCINVHASLLPKYRGAAPIQWAVINGEEYSGVSIMQMAEGLDTGDVILQEKLKIAEDETGESLFDKLSILGGKACVEALKQLEDGSATFTSQDHASSSYAKMLKKDMGRIDFGKDAREIERLIRGLYPWPSAYTTLHQKTLKIFKAQVVSSFGKEPGTILRPDKDTLILQCGKDALKVLEVQLEGKKRMEIQDFLRGYQVEDGERI